MPQHVGDVADRWLRQPAAALLLRPPQQRDHGGGLPAFRVFLDLRLRPTQILRREGEGLGLLIGEAADAHRSISPNTMSIEPRMADTSASIWPRQRKSMACKMRRSSAP